MPADFATLADLKKHWSDLPATKEDDAEQKLHEASIEIRALYPDVDARIAAGTLSADAVKLVVCRMVKRALDVPAADEMAGVTSFQESAGGVSQNFSFANPSGDMYLTKSDRHLLGVSRKVRKAFTVYPGGR